MKALITANLLAVLALPLAAQTVDSPLVAAAKANVARVAALKTQATVITNDTLVRTGGHIATTTATTSVKATLPQPMPPNDYARNQAAPQVPAQDAPPPAYSPAAATQLSQATTVTPQSHMTGQQLQPMSPQQLQTMPTQTVVPNMTAVTPPVH